MKCTYQKKLVLLMDYLIPTFKLTRLRIRLDYELPKDMVRRLPEIPSILLGSLGLPPRGEA